MSVHDRLDEAMAARPIESPRRYIGASSLYECRAAIAHQLRGYPSDPPSPKVQRIFDLGHTIEDIVVAHLKEAGFEVQEVDPSTGKQWAFRDYGGHIKCHLDGIIVLEERPYVLEIKSMNKSKFNAFVKHGVIKSHPSYHRQVHMCMAMSQIPRSLIVAYCKDDSRYHSEIVEEDPLTTATIRDQVTKVLTGDHPRIASDPSVFACRFCSKSQACWGPKARKDGERAIPLVKPTCANCQKSTPSDTGLWFCSLHQNEFGPDEICSAHQPWSPENEL